jgi:hypothetical protein
MRGSQSSNGVVCVDADGNTAVLKDAGFHERTRTSERCLGVIGCDVVMQKIFEWELVTVPMAICESKVAKQE